MFRAHNVRKRAGRCDALQICPDVLVRLCDTIRVLLLAALILRGGVNERTHNATLEVTAAVAIAYDFVGSQFWRAVGCERW